jgi:hypothetical protein
MGTPEKITKTLHCRLTDTELLVLGDEMACAMGAVATLEANKKQSADDFKAQIEKKYGEIGILAGQVRTKEIDRAVECTVTVDFEHRCVRTVRDDTGEMIEERPMTATECQAALFDVEGKPNLSKRKKGGAKLGEHDDPEEKASE